MRLQLQCAAQQPAARADLALAVLTQGRQAATEITAAVAEVRDQLWEQALFEAQPSMAAVVLGQMEDALRAYAERFPDRVAAAAPLGEALAAERRRLSGALPAPGSEPIRHPPALG